jgi:hypothetical protein
MSKSGELTPADIERITTGFVEFEASMDRLARDFRAAVLAAAEVAARAIEAEAKAGNRPVDTDLE